MNYQVAYDIQQVWYPAWWVFAIGISMFVVGLGSIIFNDWKGFSWIIGPPSDRRTITMVIACIFGVLMIGVGILNYSNFANLRKALRNGSVDIAEGKVEQ